jgi:hypothetical protein
MDVNVVPDLVVEDLADLYEEETSAVAEGAAYPVSMWHDL